MQFQCVLPVVKSMREMVECFLQYVPHLPDFELFAWVTKVVIVSPVGTSAKPTRTLQVSIRNQRRLIAVGSYWYEIPVGTTIIDIDRRCFFKLETVRPLLTVSSLKVSSLKKHRRSSQKRAYDVCLCSSLQLPAAEIIQHVILKCHHRIVMHLQRGRVRQVRVCKASTTLIRQVLLLHHVRFTTIQRSS